MSKTPKQGNSKESLNRCDMMADRAVRHPQFVRRFSYAAEACGGFEGTQGI